MLEYKRLHAFLEIIIYFSVVSIVIFILFVRSHQQETGYHAQGSILSVFFGESFETEFGKLVHTIVEFTYKKYMMMFKPILNKIGGEGGVFNDLNNQFNGIKDIMDPMRSFFISNLNEVHVEAQKHIQDINQRGDQMEQLINEVATKYKNVRDNVSDHQINLKDFLTKELASPPAGSLAWDPSNVNCAGKTWTDPDFCFAGLTSIKLKDGKEVYFRDLQIGMKLLDGIVIVCCHKFKNEAALFLYDNKYYMTGGHKVLEDNKWILVRNSKKSFFTEFIPPFVYCITTTTGTFTIDNTMFKDFSESRNPFINKTINSLILTHKNSPFIDSTIWSYPCEYLEHGFASNTLLRTMEGHDVKIENIQIGDTLAYGGKVLGKVQLLPHIFKIYNYNGIIVSSNTKVWDKKIWKNIECVEDIEYYQETPLKLFNIITTDRVLSIGKHFFMDYLETSDIDINNEIDKLLDITNGNNLVFMEEL